jgi:hydroxymethylglutaryl-CoA synthase
MQTVYAMVKSGMIAHGMAVGSDTAQSRPGDVLEYSAAAGAAAFTLGSQDVLVEIEATLSVSSDTPDFWRGAGDNYPTHMGRFTGAPSYDAQLGKAARGLLADLDAAPADFTYAVLHTPNGKFPRRMAKQLGFTPAQTEPALIVDRIGNTYSAAALLALCRVLDIAAPGDRILLVSYGSGAGSDAFSLRVTDALPAARSRGPALQTFIDRKVNLDYAAYAARRGLFRN